MNTFLRSIGLLTCCYGFYRLCIYASEHYHQFLGSYFYWAGVVFTILLLLFAVVRAAFGKNWPVSLGTSLFLGPELRQVSRQMVSEFKQGKVDELTLTDFAAAIFKRLTRVGLIGLVIAAFPILLLMQQNQLLRVQNDLFSLQDTLIMNQNEKIDSQLVMFNYQNERIDRQTGLLDTQTNLFGSQNMLVAEQNRLVDYQTGLLRTQNNLFTAQNAKVDTQNIRLNIQNQLIEADRRSSLILLMSNVLDLIQAEIDEQKRQAEAISQDSLDNLMTNGYSLSDPLIGRIASLSEGFLPYRIMQGDTLSERDYSIERGQLLLALLNSNLSDSCRMKTFEEVSFRRVYLNGFNLRNVDLRFTDLNGTDIHGVNLFRVDLNGAALYGANLRGADLEGADLRGAFLEGADLREADLEEAGLLYAHLRGADLRKAYLLDAFLFRAYLLEADFSGAILSEADLSRALLMRTKLSEADLSEADFHRARLKGADLSRANLHEAKSLTFDQLIRCKSLYEAKGIDQFKEQLMSEKPCLFTEEGCQ